MIHIGTHTSIAGGLHNAFKRVADVGGDTLQIFAKSPRGWKIPTYTEEDLQLAADRRKKYNIKGGIIHSNYLANLAKPVDEAATDVKSVIHDFDIAHAIGYDAVNVHIGKEKGRASLQEAMENMQRNVEIICAHNKKHNYDVQFLFENTAGQGSEIGSNLEEMASFYNNYLKDFPIKFCIDTAHCQGGGIDVRKRQDFVQQFDEHIGIDKLYAIHLNDAKVPVDSHLDRHAPLGHGFIGWFGIKEVVERANKHDVNLYIETPQPERRPDEIEKIKKIINGDTSRIQAEHDKYYQTVVLKKYAHMEQESLF